MAHHSLHPPHLVDCVDIRQVAQQEVHRLDVAVACRLVEGRISNLQEIIADYLKWGRKIGNARPPPSCPFMKDNRMCVGGRRGA